MSVERMVALVREQAAACERLGSPMYGLLLDRVADDVLAAGPASVVLAGHELDPGPSALALRLAGAVHALALAGEVPELAAHYPSCGGDGDAEAAWPEFRRVLDERVDDVRQGLESAPQTNEVGRAAPLMGALLRVAGPAPVPVRLWEIGTSGGLNLRADRFAYRATDGGAWGPERSPVVLDPAWDAVPQPVPAHLEVVERVGGDVAPVDPRTPDGARRLTSYVWPDQVVRLARLRGAIEVASTHPARLVTAGAAELLEGLELRSGTLTVVWHSVMWQYLGEAERDDVRSRLAELGEQAHPGSRLAHIAFEPRRDTGYDYHRFVVTARVWPGGRERVLGTAPAHGVPVVWSARSA